VGTARVQGDEIVYTPQHGWTGTVQIGYVVRDPHGASASALVDVVVGDEVLIGARTLATDLGVDIVAFEPPAPSFDADTLSLINLDGITLLADSFFQTVDALRIPLGFLGVTVAMVIGFGTTANVPALVFGTRRRHWAVVRLGRQQRLPAYSEPGGRKVVYNYDPAAAAIVSVGKTSRVGNTEWLPVDTPNGRAWLYRKYLTEQVDLQAFLADPRPTRLVHELASRLRKGQNISSIISDEGLVIALTGSPSQIAPNELAALMGDRRLRHLPGIGSSPNTPEEFTVAVAQPFLEAYDATPDVSPEVPHSRSALIPTECLNFPYLAIGTSLGVQPWLVFFEYRDGKALIAGLGIDE
jgi:Bacterial Ig domain